jgi:hypothetical protein
MAEVYHAISYLLSAAPDAGLPARISRGWTAPAERRNMTPSDGC